jgi:hypothetical protein
MMMHIGNVSDFEAQLTASVERLTQMSPEDLELETRRLDWLHARDLDYFGHGIESLMRPVEPQRPYSYGRRFIPDWLAVEREFYMAAAISCDYHGAEARHNLYGLVRVDVDATVMARCKCIVRGDEVTKMGTLRLTVRCPIDGCAYKARRNSTRVNGNGREPGRCPKHGVWLVRTDGNTSGEHPEREPLTDNTGCDV